MTFKEVMEEYFKSWGLSVRLSTSISHKKSFAYQCGDLLDLDIIDISKETIENHLAEMLSRLSRPIGMLDVKIFLNMLIRINILIQTSTKI